jgi:hypothetical protein
MSKIHPNLEPLATDEPLIRSLLRIAKNTEDPFDQADILDGVNLLRIRAAHIESLTKPWKEPKPVRQTASKKEREFLVTVECTVKTSAVSEEDAMTRMSYYDGVAKTAQRAGTNWRAVRASEA